MGHLHGPAVAKTPDLLGLDSALGLGVQGRGASAFSFRHHLRSRPATPSPLGPNRNVPPAEGIPAGPPGLWSTRPVGTRLTNRPHIPARCSAQPRPVRPACTLLILSVGGSPGQEVVLAYGGIRSSCHRISYHRSYRPALTQTVTSACPPRLHASLQADGESEWKVYQEETKKVHRSSSLR